MSVKRMHCDTMEAPSEKKFTDDYLLLVSCAGDANITTLLLHYFHGVRCHNVQSVNVIKHSAIHLAGMLSHHQFFVEKRAKVAQHTDWCDCISYNMHR